jgi:phosphoglycerate dehydrogenase-like enzyme
MPRVAALGPGSTMTKIVVEEDAFLKCIAVILDPDTPDEHRRAVADWFSPDEPDFFGWVRSVQDRYPGLFPAKVVMPASDEEFRRHLTDADAVIVERMTLGPAELDTAKRLKVVQKFGAIVANIDLAACRARDIPVEVQRRRINIAVAEHAFALMTALSRRLNQLNGLIGSKQLHDAGYDTRPFDQRYTGNSNYARIGGLIPMYGAVFGALGMGEVGREVASRCAAFGMSILYHQRNRMTAAEESEFGASYVPLDELLERSDYVSIHLPINASTRGMIGRPELRRMKPGAFLVNVARPTIVDRGALIEALDEGRLGGFGLDVGYEEPGRPDEPLLRYKNVILTPHTAPGTRQNGMRDVDEMCFKMWRRVTA